MVKPIEKPAIKHRKMNDVRLVVGIGASAGGLEALQQFFLKLPANSNIAFVIVQHLSPDYKSLMAEILGKYTPMQVVQAEHLQEVAPNRVYLIPPKKNLTIKAGHLLLTDYDHRAINHPIDRDPVCGFNGIIGDTCPRCGRRETPDQPFERIRRITGYLVGTLDRFNNGKRAEERDRVKHGVTD